MIPRVISRRVRPLWIAALASAAWVNRKDLARWAEFLRRRSTNANLARSPSSSPRRAYEPPSRQIRCSAEIPPSKTSPFATEWSRCSLAPPAWPDSGDHVKRLKRVKGIADVTAVPVAGS